MRSAAILALAGSCMVYFGCAPINLQPLDVVEFVDLNRYIGKWYEIAKYPNSFEAGCVGSTAEYGIRDDGRISVFNTCREGGLDGELRTIEGSARVVDETTNAKLGVSFFIFEAPYWIIDLDEENYQWAVVGEPSRQFLWILSRTPQLDDDVYQGIVDRLPEKGYDPAGLVVTPQPQAE